MLGPISIPAEAANEKHTCGGDRTHGQGLCASSMKGELKWETGPIWFVHPLQFKSDSVK